MTPADTSATLDQLRGLHLPGGATGPLQGEIVLALILGFTAALVLGGVRVVLARVRGSVKRAALADLAGTRHLAPPERMLAQARLLRRLVRTVRGDEAARRQGSDWASTLDSLMRTDFFSHGAGRTLVDGLYRPVDTDPAVLDAELARLIGRMRR